MGLYLNLFHMLDLPYDFLKQQPQRHKTKSFPLFILHEAHTGLPVSYKILFRDNIDVSDKLKNIDISISKIMAIISKEISARDIEIQPVNIINYYIECFQSDKNNKLKNILPLTFLLIQFLAFCTFSTAGSRLIKADAGISQSRFL